MIHLLLAVIYVSFISLGLPDSLLGAAWPSIYQGFGVPVSYSGVIFCIISVGTVLSSLQSDRMTRRFGAGGVTAISVAMLTSSTKERLEQLEETKRELEARIAEEKLAKPKIKEEFIRFWLMRFRKLDMSLKDQRQALVDTFINSIYLYDDKVLITFNYKEGTQTITFAM